MGEQGGEWFEIRDTAPARAAWSLEAVRAKPAMLALLAACCAAVVALGGVWLAASAASPRIELGSLGAPDGSADPSSADSLGDLVVDVAGAVRKPGLYHLPAASRVGDAIVAAGGFGPSVDTTAAATQLNLAAPLTDGQKILVPSRGGAAATAASGTSPGLVDLNHASESELDALPGIGPATAKKIIDARAERPFASADELLTRKIVGQATWQKIRDLVTVS